MHTINCGAYASYKLSTAGCQGGHTVLTHTHTHKHTHTHTHTHTGTHTHTRTHRGQMLVWTIQWQLWQKLDKNHL